MRVAGGAGLTTLLSFKQYLHSHHRSSFQRKYTAIRTDNLSLFHHSNPIPAFWISWSEAPLATLDRWRTNSGGGGTCSPRGCQQGLLGLL